MPPAPPTRRIVQRDEREAGALAERIVMFAVVTRRPRAANVVEGLSKPAAASAKKMLETIASWPSGMRQARVSLDFGLRGDQAERLASVMAEAHPALRLAMYAYMSPQQQARYPRLAAVEFRQIPGRNAWAARLVREATR